MALPVWRPDPTTREAGIASANRYTNAPKAADVPARYRVGKAQLPLDARLVTLREAVRAQFPGKFVGEGSTYSAGRSRDLTDAQRLDMHQAGRAEDFMIPAIERGAGQLGDQVANWIVANADRYSVQFVTWKGTNWSTGRSGDGRWYARGSDDHDNHVHAEIEGPQGHLADGPLRPAGSPGEAPWTLVGVVVAVTLGALAVAFAAWRMLG